MNQYCVYRNPTDFPGKVVVRRWRVLPGVLTPIADMAPHYVGESLEEARKTIPAGMYRLPRFDQDDPCIVEVWL